MYRMMEYDLLVFLYRVLEYELRVFIYRVLGYELWCLCIVCWNTGC